MLKRLLITIFTAIKVFFEKRTMKTYLVGGAVRDILLGKEPKDKDYVVVGSSTETMLSLGYEQVGKDFPVFLHPETKDEYALARKERKTGNGYADFEFEVSKVSLKEDLLRRDLTINSMAMDMSNQNIIDYFNGEKDLKKGVLNATSRAFIEDPVRVLRTARFASRYEFEVSGELKTLMREMVNNGEVDHLTKERVLLELKKTLSENKPSIFFEVLREVNALERVFPHIAKLVDVEQSPIYHPEGCAYTHTMLVLDNARKLTNNFKVLYTVLVHDLGKGVTPKEILPKHIKHEENGVPLVKEMNEALRVESNVGEFALSFTKNHLRMHRVLEMKPSKVVKLLKELRCVKKDQSERLEEFILCAMSDDLGKNSTHYPQGEYLRACFNAISNINNRELLATIKNKALIKDTIHQEQVRVLKIVKNNWEEKN